MHKNKVAAILLVLCSPFYVLLILGIEKISSTALLAGSLLMVLMASLILFLFLPQMPKQKRILLLLLFIIPSLAIIIMSLKQ